MPFIIWKKGGGVPTREHTTYEIAEKEAKRLVAAYPQSEFHIFERVAVVTAETKINVVKEGKTKTAPTIDLSKCKRGDLVRCANGGTYSIDEQYTTWGDVRRLVISNGKAVLVSLEGIPLFSDDDCYQVIEYLPS